MDLRYRLQKVRENVLLWFVCHFPKVANSVTCYNMGRLTVQDETLHSREVPTITVDELLSAMKSTNK